MINNDDENEANNESLFDSNILSFTSSDLEELPDYVFINCSELEKIEMPSLIIIGTCAFTNCKKLTQINFPSVKFVGVSAFEDCENLTEVTMSNAEEIKECSFTNCYNLKKN